MVLGNGRAGLLTMRRNLFIYKIIGELSQNGASNFILFLVDEYGILVRFI